MSVDGGLAKISLAKFFFFALKPSACALSGLGERCGGGGGATVPCFRGGGGGGTSLCLSLIFTVV